MIQSAPGGGFAFSGQLRWWVESPPKSKIQLLDNDVYTPRFLIRKHFSVITISTMSMCQNCSISFLGLPNIFAAHLDTPVV